ncbi:hypothetical protein BDQ17DRAFT_1409321 [Cyathus striatus]|nr:hypothetical protein BDQ17DRAFT_1409321 [Cyathus striatus]
MELEHPYFRPSVDQHTMRRRANDRENLDVVEARVKQTIKRLDEHFHKSCPKTNETGSREDYDVFTLKKTKYEPAREPNASEVEVGVEKSDTKGPGSFRYLSKASNPGLPSGPETCKAPHPYPVHKLNPKDFSGFRENLVPIVPHPSYNASIPVKTKEDELADKLAALEKRLNEEQLRRRFEDLEVRVEGVENEKTRKLRKRVSALEKLVKELESRVTCLEEESSESADEVNEESDDGGWEPPLLGKLDSEDIDRADFNA